MLCLLTFAAAVREAEEEIRKREYTVAHLRAVLTYLATAIDREAEDSSSLCRWNPNAEKMQGTFGRQALPMVWDFCEINPFGGSVGDWQSLVDLQLNSIHGAIEYSGSAATVSRGSATALPWPDGFFDAVITDPPYYDNVPYADISDFFYVWLKRTVGHLYPEHFAAEGTPKKNEAVADAVRHGGSKEKAKQAYEAMMAQAFSEAHRVLKPGGQMVVVYAHKTTLGWATLVDALRQAGFTVTEAWPLDTEMKSRLRGMESAALASSIFLVARKRVGRAVGRAASPTSIIDRLAARNDRLAAGPTGSYEDEVQPELERIVRERVETLWEMGVAGADLVIAAVGAGLRAFTRFARVEYANGEEVPAEQFLAEVEGVVLETLLEKIFVGQAASLSSSGTGRGIGCQPVVPLSSVDGPSRFYVLWRYTYKAAELDAGEAIVFTYGQQVELDGPNGLSTGSRTLVDKKKGKYRLRDYTERGDDEKLGLPGSDGQSASLIDVLHRILWLMENEPRTVPRFLNEAQPDRERLRLVAQALAGPGLKGKTEEEAQTLITTTASEQAALGKLLANWRTLVEQRMAEMPLFEHGR
jgi:putative DNA methylase